MNLSFKQFFIESMKIELGRKGLKNSWQKKFPSETTCVHCGGKARIAFTAQEKGKKGQKLISNIHKNNPEEESYWLHDAGAFAIYLCKKCLEPTTLYNQA